MGDSPRAVFLSYASQDFEAASRICESLRAAGVEVWIDQSELRGGDAWDAQIKKHIHECALFIPLISAHTNERTEGYFRREWKLSTRRLLDIADDAAFLVPVVIDDTREADARVPEEFFGAHWTRLPGGETPAAFVDRVRQLLGGDSAPMHHAQSAVTGVRAPSARQEHSTRPFAFRGKHRVRSVGLTIVVLMLILGGVAIWYYQGASDVPPAREASLTTSAIPAPNEKSIAVLPFVNMSSDKEQEYLADGISEELLNLLAQVPGLRVIARTSSFSFKGRTVDIAEIARRLNVANVLEGSVRKSGDKLRITAQLVRASDSSHLWSQTYERQMTDVFQVQDEIADAVVSELEIKLLGQPPRTRAINQQAYESYLKARAISSQYTAAAFEQSIALYQRAIALDPAYTEAWVGLAGIYCYQFNERLRPADEGVRLARQAIEKALTLDPQYALAYARLGWIAIFYDRDYQTASNHLKRALTMEPANTDVIIHAAMLSRRLGRWNQAIALGTYVVGRDPVNGAALANLGLAYSYAGRWDEAVRAFRTVLALNSGVAIGDHAVLSEALMRKGDAKAALAEAKQEPDVGWRLMLISVASYALGQATQSDAALAELVKGYKHTHPLNIATVFAFKGEADDAFEWLEKAAEQHNPDLGSIFGDRLFDKLHGDARWPPFLRKHGMAPEQLAAVTFEVKLPQ